MGSTSEGAEVSAEEPLVLLSSEPSPLEQPLNSVVPSASARARDRIRFIMIMEIGFLSHQDKFCLS